MESLLYILFGIIIGFGLGWVLSKLKTKASIPNLSDDNDREMELEKENAALKARLEKSIEVFGEKAIELKESQQRVLELSKHIATLESQEKNIKEKLTEQKAEMNNLQEKFTKEFENIAHKILKQNTNEFSKTHEKSLEGILTPFKERIVNFEKQVQLAYEKETREKASLRAEVKQLFDLNQKISQEAVNLTNALKGGVKQQGNWGEMVLEKVLNRSGLRKGAEYEAQYSTTNDQGDRVQPDIIIHLPDEKHLVIDAKVSLVAYNNLVNSKEGDNKEEHLKNHLISLRTHVKQLSEKNYQNAHGINTPDFVLMFLPIESSFSLAIENDNEFFQFAWDKKIVIVSPTTLLATLRTVSSLWKQELQNRNAMEIARQGGALYDKFKGFLDDMQKIKKGIENADTAYENAFNKLKTGKGNLIGRAEKIRELGAKTSKKIQETVIYTEEEMEEIPVLEG